MPETTIKINAMKPLQAISPMLYGIFLEEVNHAVDGGIYAELIRNRSFEDTLPPKDCIYSEEVIRNPAGWEMPFPDPESIPGWSFICKDPSVGKISLDRNVILNSANPISLRLDVDNSDGRVGISNEGFWGIPLQKGAKYNLSFFAKTETGKQSSISAALESVDGKVYDSNYFTISDSWEQYCCTFESGETDMNARFVITAGTTGSFWFDFVSILPGRNEKGGKPCLRTDLVQMLKELKPAFLRFPGGCFVEGISPSTAYHWKDTIGPVYERKGHWNLWGYRSTNGIGFHEYLQLSEDLGAEPLYVVNCGMTCQARGASTIPFEDLDNWIQDALDAIEYANGGIDTRWGAARVSNGHPDPFDLKYIEIGNENTGSDYELHYKRFYDAVKKQYPAMNIIANTSVDNSMLEILDEHYYSDPAFFISQANRYDKYNRTGPKIYVGEYAVTNECGKGNLQATLAEAIFMCEMEHSGDIVTMASYAPLFVNANDRTWNPDAIVFDNSSSYGTPSYYVQKLFAHNRADESLDVKVECGHGTESRSPVITTVAGKMASGDELILKVVNVSEKDVTAEVFIDTADDTVYSGTQFILMSDSPLDENSMQEPKKVAPIQKEISNIGSRFIKEFPAHSLTIMRLAGKK